MREKGLSTVPAVLLAAFAGLVTAVFLADWVILDVETTGRDSVNLTIPFPLVLADITAALIPDDALEGAEVPAELRENRETIMASLDAIVDAPDAVFVRIDDADTHVEICKRDGEIIIDVDADDAKVACRIPVEGIHEALEDWDWQTFEPSLFLDALHEADGGTLLEVEADDARVAVKMW